MFAKELLNKSEQELIELKNSNLKELGTLTQNILQKKEKNVKRVGQIKKLIARVNTILNQKKETIK